MSGMAVISRRNNGIPETVIEGETGLPVDEYDVEGMAAALGHLLADADLAARLGAASAVRARMHFSRADRIARMRRILELESGDEGNSRRQNPDREHAGDGLCPA